MTGEGMQRADALGLTPGLVVQELGWDSDVDADLRDDVMDALDADLIEDPLDAVDVVLLWWRDDDGDVVDGMVDAMTDLASHGYIWLLTPKVGRPGFIDPSDLTEGARTAGVTLTTSVSASPDWQAHKIVRPRGPRR
ncbi:MAG: DUF3052 domain-containing protein [Arachnia sp.]